MIRVLATGFGPFPGAPVNPTAGLMERLAAEGAGLAADVLFTARVVPTVYRGLGAALEALGRELQPEVAVHFGLAKSACGFRLEALARNRCAADRVDADGALPASAVLREGGEDLPSTLPLGAIDRALAAAGLPFEHSDDCGDYLCNAMFFHAVGRLAPDYAPDIAGFIHVPMPGAALDEDGLFRGARIILAEAVRALRQRRTETAPSTS